MISGSHNTISWTRIGPAGRPDSGSVSKRATHIKPRQPTVTHYVIFSSPSCLFVSNWLFSPRLPSDQGQSRPSCDNEECCSSGNFVAAPPLSWNPSVGQPVVALILVSCESFETGEDEKSVGSQSCEVSLEQACPRAGWW